MYKEALKIVKDIDTKLYEERYLTGSYVITKKTVYKDIDFVLYTHNVKALEDELKLFGFDLCGEDLQWKYSERDVIAYRKGPCNVIIVDSMDKFRKWQAATLLATHLKCMEKADRINIFETIIGIKPKPIKNQVYELNQVWFDEAIKNMNIIKANNPNKIIGKGKGINWMIIDDIEKEIPF